MPDLLRCNLRAKVFWSRPFAAVMPGSDILVAQGTRQSNMLYVDVVSEMVSQNTCAHTQWTAPHIYTYGYNLRKYRCRLGSSFSFMDAERAMLKRNNGGRDADELDLVQSERQGGDKRPKLATLFQIATRESKTQNNTLFLQKRPVT
jgi:hypothetical protein